MIRTIIEGCQWGADRTEDGGIHINLLDKDSNHIYTIPFSPDSMATLGAVIWSVLPEEKRREIQANISGIVIAQPGDIPSNGNGH